MSDTINRLVRDIARADAEDCETVCCAMLLGACESGSGVAHVSETPFHPERYFHYGPNAWMLMP